MSAVAEFGVAALFEAPGYSVRISDVHKMFAAYCLLNGLRCIPLVKFRIELIRLGYLVGRGPGNCSYVANVALQSMPPSREPFVLNTKGRLECLSRVN